MAKFTDSLRGYSHEIFLRDGFRCRYCGRDGSRDFDTWLTLSRDHLLPKGHPSRDDPEFIVTACSFCNGADNRYFDHADKRGLLFDNLSQKQLVSQRKKFVEDTRREYHEFWKSKVSKAT